MRLPSAAAGVLLGLAVASAAATVQTSGAALTVQSSSRGMLGASPDWTPPTGSISGATGLVRGSTTVTALASDAESSVRQVRIDLRPVGATTWATLCTTTSSPYACAWDTTRVADGGYELRAVVTDAYDNVGISATVTRTVDNQGPTVAIDEGSMPDFLRGTVTVPVLAGDAGSGVASVLVQRSTNGTSWTDLCTDTTAPYSCSWTTSGSGDAFLRAIATDALGTSTTSATALVALDNTSPTVTMSSPGSTLSGTVTLTASASDADSGVASVALEYRASSTAPWTAVCTATASPYSCRWDTTKVADGTTYAFRAVATDAVGLVTVSAATTTSTVDNRTASVSVEDPGAHLRGTVDLLANANSPSGVASVTIQYSPTGKSSWTSVCVDTASPYSCAWDTTRVTGGLYDLRAVLTSGDGSTLTSGLVTGRNVDNSPLRGVDVQATNGGVLGRVDAGDTLSLTYDAEVRLDSLVSGWTGTPRAVGLRLRDGANLTGAGGEDVLDILTSTTSSTTVGLGTVNTRGNYVKGTALVFAATMTAETTVVNGVTATRVVIRVEPTSSTSRLVKAARAMAWTPSAAARDLAGNAASTAPTEELGTLDRDF